MRFEEALAAMREGKMVRQAEERLKRGDKFVDGLRNSRGKMKFSDKHDDEHLTETFHELDPSGKDPHEAGAKLDAGKNRLGLVLGGFSKALQEVGKVGTFGANKYTDNGWKSVENGKERYTDAMLRHYFKEVEGELKDKDSELLHAAHFAWNALARLELMLEDAVWMHGADHMVKTWQNDIGDRLEAAMDDERMNIIARNGNDGLHYHEVKQHEDDFQE